MLEVDLPEDHTVPTLTRSFAACVASVTEAPIAQVPQPQADLAGAIGYWRSWLAGRGAGLVTLAQPSTFNWPGYWLAVLGQGGPRTQAEDAKAVLMFGTPAGVVLSPQDPDFLGRAATDLPPQLSGTVATIALAEHATSEMRTVDRARALAHRGLDGDRYAAKAGTFTPASETARGYDLTLIEAEAIEALPLPDGHELAHADARRNIVTRGIDLNALVGRRFRIGTVECLGQRLAEPCSHLEHLTTTGTLRGLIHRGGLRADVLTDGEISTGDRVETVD